MLYSSIRALKHIEAWPFFPHCVSLKKPNTINGCVHPLFPPQFGQLSDRKFTTVRQNDRSLKPIQCTKWILRDISMEHLEIKKILTQKQTFIVRYYKAINLLAYHDNMGISCCAFLK